MDKRCNKRQCEHICSAFRAISEDSQSVAGFTGQKLEFPVVVFDLNKEYDQENSLFIPKQDGVYVITASTLFFPGEDVAPQDFVVNLTINVNDEVALAGQNSLPQGLFSFDGLGTTVTGILQLKKCDKVEVSANPTINGAVFPKSYFTHFEAARVSSPLYSPRSHRRPHSSR
ncbi:hypothetical protein [Rossellomorea sp. YZS02]|uniref:hypothetical protein n=1 Tax=Rossellomorea sp. YZS02 TaxID=3097358 RepID=UPI002A0EA215|nr:hypothetical protein [Rossellomorea sp. YZS02]MDX8344945.1 hypothetical protein [Rossellomorea sp. YZS02]